MGMDDGLALVFEDHLSHDAINWRRSRVWFHSRGAQEDASGVYGKT